MNLLCLLFTLLAAIGWQTVNLQNRKTVKYQGAFSENRGVFGQAFPPLLLVHPSIFHFFCFASNSVTRLETLSDEGWPLSYCPIKIDFILVFTKSINSTFRAFWLAPVTRNILAYSLFSDRSQDGDSLRDIFGTRNLSDKWSSRANKYQESD